MANLFICPFKHEWQVPKAIQPEIPFNDSEDILKRVKESGICWFESSNGRKQAGSVNTFTDSGLKMWGSFQGFLSL